MSKRSSLQSYINTSVPPGTSKDNIETLLQRVGADAFRWSSMAGHETLEASLEWESRRVAVWLAPRTTAGGPMISSTDGARIVLLSHVSPLAEVALLAWLRGQEHRRWR